MSHNVGADELRVRARLRQLVDGPAPQPPAMPPGPPPDGYRPTARPRDWLDDILDSNAGPAATAPERPARGPVPLPGPVSKEPAAPAPAPAKSLRKPRRPQSAPRAEQQADPRQSLLDAWDRTPRRVRWLAHHATAAIPGWWLGWVAWGTDTAAWYAAGHWTSPSAFVLYGLGGMVLALYRRSRHWAWPAAWAATVPVASVVLGVLLYGTGYQP
jgi:hypothetical protein